MKNWLHDDQLLNHLDQHNLLCRKSIIDGDFEIIDFTSRNKNFLINQRNPIFVKIGIDQQRAQSLDIEAEVYRLGTKNKELSEFIPNLKYANSGVLITEAFEKAELLDEVFNKPEKFGKKTTGVELGRGLAIISQLPCLLESKEKSVEIPWAFLLNAPSKEIYLNLSSAALEIIRIIQKDKTYINELVRLQENWNDSGFIHNDIKATNILIHKNVKEAPSVKFIDWELCSRGDVHWDLGNVWTSVLHAWLSSIENPSAPSQSRVQLSNLFEFNQGVYEGYRSTYSNAELSFSLLKSIQYAGVSLLKTVIEMVEDLSKISRIHILYIQISDFLIKNPIQASVQLFGLNQNELKHV